MTHNDVAALIAEVQNLRAETAALAAVAAWMTAAGDWGQRIS